MPALAFYKGKGGWLDSIIRLATRSDYSHVEYVPAQEYVQPLDCVSSSGLDGGVRRTHINLESGNWDVVALPWVPETAREFFHDKIGSEYDYTGIVFSQLFSFRRQNSRKWFCSEICAAAIGLDAPETYSPGSLKLAIEKLNEVYTLGMNDATDSLL